MKLCLFLVFTLLPLSSLAQRATILDTLSLFNPVGNLLNLSPLQDNYIDNVLEEEYDFVIIGGGSGGSVLANRLSENHNWTVLLIEAGNQENFLSDIPIMAAFQSATPLNWGYLNEQQKGACLGLKEQRCNAARGKVLGGTSALNFMIYTRGNREDYDSWNRLGNAGWSYDEVLKYFKKSEDCSACHNIDYDYHGFQGEMKIEHPGVKSSLLKKFFKGGEYLGYGINDPNGRRQLGFSEAQATLHRGRRCSAARAFLTGSVRNRPNLDIALRTRAIKILIDNKQKRAFGVEALRDHRRIVIRARKEVLLAAGTFNSPQVLMLSGIGPVEHLKSVGITPISDLPVGFNLQDHISFAHLLFLVNQSSIIVSDSKLQSPEHILNYLLNGKGPYTIPGGALGLAFIRTRLANTTHKEYAAIPDYPDMELVLGAGGLNVDTMGTLSQLLRIPEAMYRQMYLPVQHIPGFSIAPVMMRPKSRGRIMLKDSNPLHWPLIHANYFEQDVDLDVLLEGIRNAIAIVQTPAFKDVDARLHDIPLSECAQHAFNSDDYWKCTLRNLATSLGHPVGTCKMGPASDTRAVVDARLRVHGIDGLRVVDASIMPHIIAGHTNSVVMMIGEKAADMIKEDWS